MAAAGPDRRPPGAGSAANSGCLSLWSLNGIPPARTPWPVYRPARHGIGTGGCNASASAVAAGDAGDAEIAAASPFSSYCQLEQRLRLFRCCSSRMRAALARCWLTNSRSSADTVTGLPPQRQRCRNCDLQGNCCASIPASLPAVACGASEPARRRLLQLLQAHRLVQVRIHARRRWLRDRCRLPQPSWL